MDASAFLSLEVFRRTGVSIADAYVREVND